MAIHREDSGAYSKKKKRSNDPAKLDSVIDQRKQQLQERTPQPEIITDERFLLNTGKLTASSKEAIKHVPIISHKRYEAPSNPDETGWLDFLRSTPFLDVNQYLTDNPEQMTPTLALVIRNVANKMLRQTRSAPTNYNQWLDFFSSMTGGETDDFILEHRGSMSNEAYAAARRWVEIHDDPSQIDKIVQSRLEQAKTQEITSIMEASKSGNKITIFEAIRDNLAYKIEDGSGARDTTVLIKQLNETLTTLDEYYREAGLKGDETSSIRKVLINSRRRANRPKVTKAKTRISDYDDMESL